MEKIIEELKGSAAAAICAGILLVFILGLFGLSGGAGGEIAEVVRKFVQTIGGS